MKTCEGCGAPYEPTCSYCRRVSEQDYSWQLQNYHTQSRAQQEDLNRLNIHGSLSQLLGPGLGNMIRDQQRDLDAAIFGYPSRFFQTKK